MKTFNINLGGYRIIQLSNQSHSQMMSYIVTTPNNHILLIDGGMEADAPYLHDMLVSLGGKVDMLFITHCHNDHFSGPLKLLREANDIEFKSICYNFPPQDWLNIAEDYCKPATDKFFAEIPLYKGLVITPIQGDVYEIDGMKIEILKDCSDYLEYDIETELSPINDNSIIFRLVFPNGKKALFLGDLGLNSGNKLAEMCGNELKCDIVSMAHHGQNGVGKNVYELCSPSVCLWTAPDWLWENDAGNGPGTGPWKTLEVRAWMDELGVTMNGTEADGDVYVI